MKRAYPEIETTEKFVSLLDNVDAVVIATGGCSHYKLAKRALLDNKDVFVEKPLALSVKDGEDLMKLADKKKKILMVGHLLLYHPGIRKLKNYIDDGALGDIRYIYSQRVNLGRIRIDENALWSFGPHDVSVVIYLVGMMPEKVQAVGESYLMDGIFDVVFLTLYFGRKIMAHIHLSWLDPHKVRKFTIVGSKKMAVFDDMESMEKIRIYDKGVDYTPTYANFGEALSLRSGDILIPKLETGEPLKMECKHFIKCIEQRKNPVSDGKNGVQVIQVLDAAQKSLNAGGELVHLHDCATM
jgi:predicted dehydrogenase